MDTIARSNRPLPLQHNSFPTESIFRFADITREFPNRQRSIQSHLQTEGPVKKMPCPSYLRLTKSLPSQKENMGKSIRWFRRSVQPPAPKPPTGPRTTNSLLRLLRAGYVRKCSQSTNLPYLAMEDRNDSFETAATTVVDENDDTLIEYSDDEDSDDEDEILWGLSILEDEEKGE